MHRALHGRHAGLRVHHCELPEVVAGPKRSHHRAVAARPTPKLDRPWTCPPPRGAGLECGIWLWVWVVPDGVSLRKLSGSLVPANVSDPLSPPPTTPRSWCCCHCCPCSCRCRCCRRRRHRHRRCCYRLYYTQSEKTLLRLRDSLCIIPPRLAGPVFADDDLHPARDQEEHLVPWLPLKHDQSPGLKLDGMEWGRGWRHAPHPSTSLRIICVNNGQGC